MIAAILERHGLRTGAYLSPHLISFAERVEIDGRRSAPSASPPPSQRAAAAAALVDRTLEPRRPRHAVRGAHRGRLLGAGARRASRSPWSRPGSAAATTRPA